MSTLARSAQSSATGNRFRHAGDRSIPHPTDNSLHSPQINLRHCEVQRVVQFGEGVQRSPCHNHHLRCGGCFRTGLVRVRALAQLVLRLLSHEARLVIVGDATYCTVTAGLLRRGGFFCVGKWRRLPLPSSRSRVDGNPQHDLYALLI